MTPTWAPSRSSGTPRTVRKLPLDLCELMESKLGVSQDIGDLHELPSQRDRARRCVPRSDAILLFAHDSRHRSGCMPAAAPDEYRRRPPAAICWPCPHRTGAPPSRTIASSTGCRSNGERLMTLSTSLVAVCCSSDSVSSRVRACTSSNSRVFSMAITAWSGEGLQQLRSACR